MTSFDYQMCKDLLILVISNRIHRNFNLISNVSQYFDSPNLRRLVKSIFNTNIQTLIPCHCGLTSLNPLFVFILVNQSLVQNKPVFILFFRFKPNSVIENNKKWFHKSTDVKYMFVLKTAYEEGNNNQF